MALLGGGSLALTKRMAYPPQRRGWRPGGQSADSEHEVQSGPRATNRSKPCDGDPRLVALRAKVLATHSDVCMYLADIDAARASSGRAITEAEQSGDLTAVMVALRARQLVATGPEGIDERSRLVDRMAAIGRETRDPLTRMWAQIGGDAPRWVEPVTSVS